MQFFIDSAHFADIQEGLSLGFHEGVTTNPTLLAKENVIGQEAVIEYYRKISNLPIDHLSLEVTSSCATDILEEGRRLAKINTNVVIKIPMTTEGLLAIRTLSQEGIRTNCTLIFSPLQALLAAKAGATYVSPFVGRLMDTGGDGFALLRDIRNIFDDYVLDTQILAASIRNREQAQECAKIGVDAITAPLHVLKSTFQHDLTDAGLKRFEEDLKKFI